MLVLLFVFQWGLEVSLPGPWLPHMRVVGCPPAHFRSYLIFLGMNEQCCYISVSYQVWSEQLLRKLACKRALCQIRIDQTKCIQLLQHKLNLQVTLLFSTCKNLYASGDALLPLWTKVIHRCSLQANLQINSKLTSKQNRKADRWLSIEFPWSRQWKSIREALSRSGRCSQKFGKLKFNF